MIFRPSRERRGPDRFLEAKMVLFAVGAALGIAGMITENRLIIWFALAVLLVGFALRFLGQRE